MKAVLKDAECRNVEAKSHTEGRSQVLGHFGNDKPLYVICRHAQDAPEVPPVEGFPVGLGSTTTGFESKDPAPRSSMEELQVQNGLALRPNSQLS